MCKLVSPRALHVYVQGQLQHAYNNNNNLKLFQPVARYLLGVLYPSCERQLALTL